MRNPVRAVGDRYLSPRLDFRVRLFNILAIAGIFVSVIVTIAAIANGEPALSILFNASTGVIAAALLRYSSRSGRYRLCYIITIVMIFLMAFPAIFFVGGGYEGAMPLFFVFAILFTAFMLEGLIALVIALIELFVYVGLLVLAYLYPEAVTKLPTQLAVLADKIIGMTVVSASLGITMFLHLRMYNRQRRELEAAREEALKLSEVKNVFLANMSHEIRTPINVMLGMTEMVLRDSRDENVTDYARKIQNAGKMLLVLVSNILDVSKIEAGKLEMTEDGYRTAVLIQELGEIGAESARRQGIAFNVQVDEALPSELSGDVLRIKQIVSNFLSNAAKYTSAGTITLGFERAAASEGYVTLRVSVADTGIGIKEENLALLFDAFARLDLPAHRSIEGTGLGLKIAKDLTERMNGKIFVESRYGEGSVFWIEIPQRIVDAKPLGSLNSPSDNASGAAGESFTAPDARILVVDDNEENVHTVKTLLRRTLMRLDTACCGADCVAAVKSAEYDLILLDYMMPDMDGIETLHKLRAERPGFDAPVIALTANAVSGTEDKLLREGFAAYIVKPFRAEVLEEAIASRLPPSLVERRSVQRRDWASRGLKDALSRALEQFGVSLEEGLAGSGGDLSLLARMAETFVGNHPGAISRMKAALPDTGEPELETLLHLTHSLKGSAGFIGASGLAALAARAERACAHGDERALRLVMPLLLSDWDAAGAGLAAFAEHVRAVEPGGEPAARGFSASRLKRFINRRIRAAAIDELELLIGESGGGVEHELLNAKKALRELDFDSAKRLLENAGVLEDKDG